MFLPHFQCCFVLDARFALRVLCMLRNLCVKLSATNQRPHSREKSFIKKTHFLKTSFLISNAQPLIYSVLRGVEKPFSKICSVRILIQSIFPPANHTSFPFFLKIKGLMIPALGIFFIVATNVEIVVVSIRCHV